MDGIIVINKPSRLTSHDVVSRVRHIVKERRAGHTGTLDPMATGVLILLLGRATRLARYLNDAEKEYEAVVRLGLRSQTGDSEGVPDEVCIEQLESIKATQIWFNRGQLEEALTDLRGNIWQVPPMYSAKKIAGQKLYELARQGIVVERPPVRVLVNEFELHPFPEWHSVPREAQSGPARQETRSNAFSRPGPGGTQDVSVRVVCSSGTYVRGLAESLGDKLGSGGHLAGLRRTRAGAFTLIHSLTLNELESLAMKGQISQSLISPTAALSHMAQMHLTSAALERVLNGAPVSVDCTAALKNGEHIVMLSEDGTLVAVGEFDLAGCWVRPKVVLAAN